MTHSRSKSCGPTGRLLAPVKLLVLSEVDETDDEAGDASTAASSFSASTMGSFLRLRRLKVKRRPLDGFLAARGVDGASPSTCGACGGALAAAKSSVSARVSVDGMASRCPGLMVEVTSKCWH